MIFSLIIFIWLQKSGRANMHFFKSGGAKAPPAPPLPTPMDLLVNFLRTECELCVNFLLIECELIVNFL